MGNSKLMVGSINLTKLNNLARAANKAFTKSKNGDIYCNINVWVNEEADQYGNHASVQTNYKDAPKEDKTYIGNLKYLETKNSEPQPITDADFPAIPADDDLPF